MMRWLVGAVVLTVGIFIWVGFPLWIESSNEENYSDSDSRQSVEPMISGFNDVDASLILEVKDQERDGSYPPIVGRDDQVQFNEEPVYRGPTTILGEPADPEENLQGVDTYTGPIIALGTPSDPNGDDGGEAFAEMPIQLGQYSDPSEPTDPNEESSIPSVQLGEPADPDEQFYFSPDFEPVTLGEASEPDDP